MTQVLGYLILAGVGACLIGVLFRPYWAMPLVMSMFTLKQLMGTYLPVFRQISPLFNLLVFVVVLVAAGTKVLGRDRTLSGFKNGLAVTTLLLWLYATTAILWTPGNGWERWKDGYAYWIMQCWILPITMVSIRDFRKTLVPIMLVGTLAALLYYTNPKASWYTGRLTIELGGKGTGSEIRTNSLAVSEMGGLMAIMAALMLPERRGLLINGLRIAAIMTGLGLGITSGARAEAVFAVGSIALFYPMSRRVKNLNQFILTSAGTVGILGVVYIGFKLFLSAGGEEQSRRWSVSHWGSEIADRVGEAWLAIDAYIGSPQNWLQGLGTNAYSYLRGYAISYPHNATVEMISELGVIGITLYVTACFFAFFIGRRLFRAYRDEPGGRATVAALLASGFYLWSLSQKQYTFVAVPDPWWIWMIMAKLATHDLNEQKEALAAWRNEYGDEAFPDEEPSEVTEEELEPVQAY